MTASDAPETSKSQRPQTPRAESDSWPTRIGVVTAAGLTAAALFASLNGGALVEIGALALAAGALWLGLTLGTRGRTRTLLTLILGLAVVMAANQIAVGMRLTVLVAAFPAFVIVASASLGPAAGFATANAVVLTWALVAGLSAGGLDPLGHALIHGPGRAILDLALLAVLLGVAALAAAWSRWDADPRIGEELASLRAERGRLDSQLESVESLAAAGWLVTHVAHEVSNPLQAMDNFVFVLLDETPHEDPRREYLVLLKQAIDRIAQYLDQLSDFYRASETSGPADVNATVGDVFRFLERQLQNANVKVTLDLAPELPLTAVSPEPLRQALLNVVLNSVEAMPEGGDLTVSTASSGDSTVVAIQDTGPGIAEADRERVFAPFFTTKSCTTKSGRGGTGLGLSITRRILRSHGGDVEVDGSTSVGARLLLKLPPSKSGT